ncbi:FHA domain-containing protein [Tolypothrix tenuis PCC 7101]|uniref:FHA domain-containing protein n=1 Tax=Tolypothrix tenuis PCC 7101 TaxID=231146 RepID=A0A1Z4NA48_9CYAN|nr:FHA domain-containing protein [Aulosira sp. FACHB-113]BAZ02603.1 FHA domain-containing protein [Tolypothrix tenuis PCC 7101]BAZ73476.1 FHA domain-containing protein [Aulosira laxa NIES-50]
MTEISNLHFLKAKGSSMRVELQDKELERRLNLFQVFVKLYEQNSSLLEEIFQLENIAQESFLAMQPIYIQGVVNDAVVYIITNLCDNKTQNLHQSQQIWTIGRDISNGIAIDDQYLSERHAAIQYINDKGFYLIDFKSSNGSFVNGEQVFQPTKLHDGDRIRLGLITFDFFINHSCRTLPTVAVELLMHLVQGVDDNPQKIFTPGSEPPEFPMQKLNHAFHLSDDSSLMNNFKYQHTHVTLEDKSEILERFFSQQLAHHQISKIQNSHLMEG